MMKSFCFFFTIALGLLTSCGTSKKTLPAPAAAPAPKQAFVTWDKKKIELGAVKKGDKRSMNYEFTNTSGTDIQIDIVDACDCTKVDFPRGMIAPGGKGSLDVVFNSAEKEAPETIGINVVFKQTDAAGNPRIEVVEYTFTIEK
ncbi:MAG: DUF1573 domain-containing protein [Lewinellaceae bacterium]|nr:DUF1573 domain-containing protein [Lewinellaceae bacterium]